MNKTATINARIEPALKQQAEAILHAVGLSTAEAIRIFYIQVCINKGVPFEVKLPNDKTLEAIQNLESGKGEEYENIKDLWNDLGDA